MKLVAYFSATGTIKNMEKSCYRSWWRFIWNYSEDSVY